MFQTPGSKRVVPSPPQPWIKFNDSPTPSESPSTHHQPHHYPSQSQHYNQSSYQLSNQVQSSSSASSQSHQPTQQQPHSSNYYRQSKVSSSLSPPLSDHFSPNEIPGTNPNHLNTNLSNGTIELANFDFNAASIEDDPKILHPVPLRVSPDGQLIPYDSQNGTPNNLHHPHHHHNNINNVHHLNSTNPSCIKPNSSCGSIINVNAYGNSSGSGVSSLTTSTPSIPINNPLGLTSSSLWTVDIPTERKGAFTVYRKTDHSPIEDTDDRDSNTWLEMLKAKYHPPKPVQMPRSIYDLFQNKELVDYIQDLQERCYRLETMNNELIHKMANLMEDQSYHQFEYKRLFK